MPKTRSISEARGELPSLVRSAEKGEVIEITRRGKRVAILISARQYSQLTNRRPDLWAALQSFRRQFDLKELRIEEIYREVRDRGPGREIAL